MKLSQKIIVTFTIGALTGLLLGAVLWRTSESGLKTQQDPGSLLADGMSNQPIPNANELKSPSDRESPPSIGDRIAQAKEAFLNLGKLGSSNWSSITGGPAFTKAMMGLSGFTSSDYAALFSELSTEGLSEEVMATPLMAWGAVDAKAALDFAMADKKLQTKENILAMVVHQLAKTDPTAAGLAVAKMEKDERTRCQTAIVVALFETDRPAAVRLAEEFGDAKTSSKLYQNWAEDDLAAATSSFGAGHPGQEEIAWELARTVLAENPAGYKTWVDSLQGTVSSAAHARVVLSLIETDAASGARALERILKEEPNADNFIRDRGIAPSVVNQWWKSGQPQEIGTWASSLTGEVQTQAVGDVAKTWAGKNSADASVWIKSLPIGNARDAAVTHLINAIRDEFPADAIEWAQSISNPEQQAKALKSITPPAATN